MSHHQLISRIGIRLIPCVKLQNIINVQKLMKYQPKMSATVIPRPSEIVEVLINFVPPLWCGIIETFSGSTILTLLFRFNLGFSPEILINSSYYPLRVSDFSREV